MEIRFFLTQKDIWNFTKYVLIRTSLRRISLLFGVVIILAIFLITITAANTNAGAGFIVLFNNILPFVLLLGGTGVALPLIYWRASSKISRVPGVLGEHSITISLAGLRHKTEVSDAILSWRIIKAIKQDSDNIFFLANSNVVIAHVIPKRAFTNEQAAAAFFGWAQAYWVNGQGPAR